MVIIRTKLTHRKVTKSNFATHLASRLRKNPLNSAHARQLFVAGLRDDDDEDETFILGNNLRTYRTIMRGIDSHVRGQEYFRKWADSYQNLSAGHTSATRNEAAYKMAENFLRSGNEMNDHRIMSIFAVKNPQVDGFVVQRNYLTEKLDRYLVRNIGMNFVSLLNTVSRIEVETSHQSNTEAEDVISFSLKSLN